MNTRVELRQVNGALAVPASKSMTQRVCAAALLHKGDTLIEGAGHSEDELAALNIIRQLGATVVSEKGALKISSTGYPAVAATFIDCGESGLSARLFTPIAALCTQPVVVNGSGSLLRRPMGPLLDLLPLLEVSVASTGGCLPLTIQGPLAAKTLSIDGSLSSQFISGLLFAYSSAAREKVSINVTNAVSRAYLDLSLEVLALFGKVPEREAYSSFTIDPAHFKQQDTIQVSIEGDWSSAAFWIAAAAIKGNIILSGLKEHSSQPDKAICGVATQCGAILNWDNQLLQVQSGALTAFHYDATDSPDLFPVLSVLAGCCSGESSIRGLHRLLHKESNREESITQLLTALGVPYRTVSDTLHITGVPGFNDAIIDSNQDHRIVMAATLAALRCAGTITIRDAEAVNKSYPDFFEDIERLGGLIQVR